MTVVRAVEDEYWSVQYKADVSGRGKIFWPDDGEGKYASVDVAEEWARNEMRRNAHSGWREEARVIHVVRRIEYGQPLVSEDST